MAMEKLSIKNVLLLLWATILLLLGGSYLFYAVVRIKGYMSLMAREQYLIGSGINLLELKRIAYFQIGAKIIVGVASMLAATGIVLENAFMKRSWTIILSVSILGLIVCGLEELFTHQWDGGIIIPVIVGAEAIRRLMKQKQNESGGHLTTG